MGALSRRLRTGTSRRASQIQAATNDNIGPDGKSSGRVRATVFAANLPGGVRQYSRLRRGNENRSTRKNGRRPSGRMRHREAEEAEAPFGVSQCLFRGPSPDPGGGLFSGSAITG